MEILAETVHTQTENITLMNLQEIIQHLDNEELKEEIKQRIDFPSTNYDDIVGEDKVEEQQLDIKEINLDEDSDSDSTISLEDVEKIVLKDVILILNSEDLVIKKKRYSDAHRRAQQKYREKYPEKYRESQRKLYNELKNDEEWKARHNAKNRESQKAYRDRKKAELIASGIELKARGRPRKTIIETSKVVEEEKHIEV